jgi:thiamine transport system permease protein
MAAANGRCLSIFGRSKARCAGPSTPGEKLALGSMVVGLLLFLLTPLLALVWQSLVDRDGQFTLAYYQALPTLRRDSVVFVPPLVALRNSLGYALLTVALPGCWGCSRRRC